MTFSAKQISQMYLDALWNKHEASDPAAECTAKQMEDINQDIADVECEAGCIGLDLTETERTFAAALGLRAL